MPDCLLTIELRAVREGKRVTFTTNVSQTGRFSEDRSTVLLRPSPAGAKASRHADTFVPALIVVSHMVCGTTKSTFFRRRKTLA
jgi:hypothetical protein